MKTTHIRHNWQLIPRDAATEDVVSHSLHYGGAVFEWIRVYSTEQWPKIFKLREHIERLFYSAKVMDLKIPYSVDELCAACLQVVKENGIDAWYLRPIVYLGTGAMGLSVLDKEIELNVSISLWKWWKYLSNDPINVKIPRIRRVDPSTTDMNAKISWNYANSILASSEIKKAWFDEALLLDTSGYIAEWPWENIFFIKNEEVFTPAEGGILPWITRATVIEVFNKELDIIVQEVNIHPDELGEYDEAFFVGTAAEVTPIGSITNEKRQKFEYTSGNEESLTTHMKELYHQITHGTLPTYMHRLS